MPSAWRIVRDRHASDPWSGEGARLLGGRWNRPGTPVVYASDTRALALLEVLVRLDDAGALDGYHLCEVRFPTARIETLDADELPSGWSAHPPHASTQRLGDGWVNERRSPVLRVPSVVVPEEHNFVLNPAHPGWKRLSFGEPRQFRLDPRLRGR